MKIWDSFFGKKAAKDNSSIDDVMRAELRRSFQQNMEKRKSVTLSAPLKIKRESVRTVCY
jgi:hypothetical protein